MAKTIYRIRDGEDALLYIGITGRGLFRFREHLHTQTWWQEVASIHFEHIEDDRVALAREKEIIATEQPRYNRTYNDKPLVPACNNKLRTSLAIRQERGVFTGPCPIGYSRQIVDGDYIPVPNVDAPKVIAIWQKYAEGNDSYHSLTDWINTELKLLSRGGCVWQRKTVQVLFENHWFYRGWVTRYRKKGKDIKYRGQHQAIISDELAERVLALRDGNRREHVGRPSIYCYLLNSILFCSSCGQRLRGRPSHGKLYYSHFKKSPCSWGLVKAKGLEQQVLSSLRQVELPSNFDELRSLLQNTVTRVETDGVNAIIKY